MKKMIWGFNMKNKIMSKEEQIESCQKDWSTIRHIIDPCEEAQLEAINQFYGAIIYIDNPTIKVQLEACKQNKDLIMAIDNPCEELLTYLYGELTNIKANNKVCKLCNKTKCDFKTRKNKKWSIRVKCKYFVEHLAYQK